MKFGNAVHQANSVFRNNGDGTFTDISEFSGADDTGIGRGIALGDFNNDGFIDIFLVNIGRLDGTPGVARLLQNDSVNSNHWLKIKLVGRRSNRDGVGARIRISTEGGAQVGEMGASQAHMSHSITPVHFGLGSSSQIDLVEIQWPSGIVQTLTEVEADKLLLVAEP